MQEQAGTISYRCGDRVVLPAARRLLCSGREVELEAKVFDLIMLLIEHRDRALDKQEIIAALWGPRPITDSALSQLVFKARRAFDDDGARQAAIRTVYGRGLQWIAPIEAVAEEPAESPARVAPLPTRKPARKLWLAAAALSVVVAAALWLVPRIANPTASPPLRLALLPVENATGDAALDWTVNGLPGLIGSLLGDTRGLDVVDPLQVARVWGFSRPQDRSEADHLRFVTGAGVVVGGRLRKLADKLYELTLQVDGGKGAERAAIVLTGEDPAALGLLAVTRIRRALKLTPTAAPALDGKPRDNYLAETFARGMDLAMHGSWQDAKPYFAVVAKGDRGFLPARLMLARSRANTDEPDRADIDYADLLEDARRLGQPRLVAQVLVGQASRAINSHHDATALQLTAKAVTAAQLGGDPQTVAQAWMHTARIAARTGRVDAAMEAYRHARALIQATPIPQLRPSLENVMAFIAEARHDPVAATAAGRAELAADEAIGDERGVAIASFNLGWALAQNERPLDALPLLGRTWAWSERHRDAALQVAAGNMLASTLYDMGLYQELQPIADNTARLARQQQNPFMQARMLDLRAGAQYYTHDRTAALASCREASALVDTAQDPSSILDKLAIEAFVAEAADPASLAGVSRRMDAAVARLQDPAQGRFMGEAVRAMAAAAAGDLPAARKALAAAADAPRALPDFLRGFALQIALVTHDDGVVQGPLHDFDPGAADVSADTLHLYAAWSERRGDTAAAERARRQLATMRRDALAALARGGLDLSRRDGAQASVPRGR